MVATSINHPRLTKTDSASIQTLLQKYDYYSREVTERARKFVGDCVVLMKNTKSAQLQSLVNYK